MEKAEHTIGLSKEVLKRLDELAQTIGTSAQELYPYYCSFVKTEAIIAMLPSLIFAIAAIICVIISLNLYKKTKYDKEYFRGAILSGLASIVAFCLSLVIIQDNLPSILYPEVKAISEIIQDLGIKK